MGNMRFIMFMANIALFIVGTILLIGLACDMTITKLEFIWGLFVWVFLIMNTVALAPEKEYLDER